MSTEGARPFTDRLDGRYLLLVSLCQTMEGEQRHILAAAIDRLLQTKPPIEKKASPLPRTAHQEVSL